MKINRKENICICGLGNPGTQYEKTRHNIGFQLLDYYAENEGYSDIDKEKFGGLYCQKKIGDVTYYLLKPMKFMNLSGEVVIPFLKYFKIPLTNLIVLHDEIDLSFADVRLKEGGGHRGHNGLRNIIQLSKQNDFWRVRLGVDRPKHKDVASYVLANFTLEEISNMLNYMIDAKAVIDKLVNI